MSLRPGDIYVWYDIIKQCLNLTIPRPIDWSTLNQLSTILSSFSMHKASVFVLWPHSVEDTFHSSPLLGTEVHDRMWRRRKAPSTTHTL